MKLALSDEAAKAWPLEVVVRASGAEVPARASVDGNGVLTEFEGEIRLKEGEALEVRIG